MTAMLAALLRPNVWSVAAAGLSLLRSLAY